MFRKKPVLNICQVCSVCYEKPRDGTIDAMFGQYCYEHRKTLAEHEARARKAAIWARNHVEEIEKLMKAEEVKANVTMPLQSNLNSIAQQQNIAGRMFTGFMGGLDGIYGRGLDKG